MMCRIEIKVRKKASPLAEKIAAIEKALRIYSKAQWALDMADALAERAKDVAAMEEALGKLPRTADGVVVVPGTRVWYVREGYEPEAHVIRGYEYESSTVVAPDGYANSTRAAALAAAAKGQGKPE
jgi:hypothetical protein